MNRQQVVLMVQNDMRDLVDTLAIENVADHRASFMRYFDLLEVLTDLPETSQPAVEAQSDTVDGTAAGNRPAIEPEHDGPAHPSRTGLYAFVRKLRGGYIPDLNYSLNEGTVRKLRVEHGDYLAIDRQVEDESGPKYWFTLAKKGNGDPAPGRVELSLVIVESLDGELVIRPNNIDLPTVISLRELDIIEYDITKGDIIDVAFKKDNPEFVRVIFKHPIESLDKPAIKVTQPVDKRPKEESANNEPESTSSPQELPLAGKRLLVMGCEPRKAQYKKRLEELGAIFDWIEGGTDHKSSSQIASKIMRADGVLILLDFIRHRASKDAVAICKAQQVPFKAISGLGIKAVIDGALEVAQGNTLEPVEV